MCENNVRERGSQSRQKPSDIGKNKDRYIESV